MGKSNSKKINEGLESIAFFSDDLFKQLNSLPHKSGREGVTVNVDLDNAGYAKHNDSKGTIDAYFICEGNTYRVFIQRKGERK